MALNVAENLQKIISLKEEAIRQEKDFKEGKLEKAPSVSSRSFDMMEKMIRNMNGDFSQGRTSVQESLTTTDVVKLIPKVIEGELREAAEPEYLATRFMSIIHVEGGNTVVYVVPIVGELHAHEVGEGTRYQEESVDFNTAEEGRLEVRVKKFGLKVSISEEALADSSWDIYGINVRKMGQAMGRLKEEQIMNAFSDHGMPVFDNDLRVQMPEAGTTGRNADGQFNDTLSTEDFLDLVLALMGNDMTPTDIIMHPLTWVIFAKNSMIGNGLTYGAFGGQAVHPWGATQGTGGFAGLPADQGPQQLILRPDQVQNRLPMPLRINFSNQVHFDKAGKKFDMYCIDKDNVGVIVEKESLQTENWTDPERDVRLLKVKERYGVGITNNGRGIAVARNIAVAPTYPVPPTVNINLPLAQSGSTSADGGSGSNG